MKPHHHSKKTTGQTDFPQKPGSGKYSEADFLPTTYAEMKARGWQELDILLITGDAYVDHPTFGIPLLGRVLEAAGYRVGIIAQPRWDNTDDVKRMGRPRLFCGISAGCLDSMLCHYTAFRKKRHDDAYTPGGKCGARPNRATIVYTGLVKAAFPGIFVALGGIEASLRRNAHYDFWTDKLRRSLLLDSKADLLLYGMGEDSICRLAERLDRHESLTGLAGSVRVADTPEDAEILPSYEEILEDHRLLLKATSMMELHMHRNRGKLAQKHGNKYIITEAPPKVLSGEELDRVYSLPFTRMPHISYTQPIPAWEMVRWSITAVRGCAGGCAFCSIALHQGRRIRSRTPESIRSEVRTLSHLDGWKGNISDVGGPTANLWGASCRTDAEGCRRHSCLSPSICPNLIPRQDEYLELLRSIRRMAGIRNVGIGSGIRHDLALKDPRFIDGLSGEFTSGQIKLAPEHGVDKVLRLMRKSDFSCFEKFCDLFIEASKAHGKEQYIVPYVMSAYPGCTMEDMKTLAHWFHSRGWRLQQAQCFIPTPGTMATAMYYSECDPEGHPIHVAKTDRERMDQHAVLYDESDLAKVPPPYKRQARPGVGKADEWSPAPKNSEPSWDENWSELPSEEKQKHQAGQKFSRKSSTGAPRKQQQENRRRQTRQSEFPSDAPHHSGQRQAEDRKHSSGHPVRRGRK